MTAKLVWITPNAEQVIGYCARVSNPANQDNPNVSKLLSYCIKNKHWSVFEMASACIEIEVPRDISRQILRHRSFHFQEFSQRYADVTELGFITRECREQDTTNRQKSIETKDEYLNTWWLKAQQDLLENIDSYYKTALELGIAKEVARVILPEGLTKSRLYMTGTIRDWIHYCEVRQGNGTQKEHIEIANQIAEVLKKELPTIWSTLDDNKDNGNT